MLDSEDPKAAEETPMGDDLHAAALRVMKVAREMCRADLGDVIADNGYSVTRRTFIDFTAYPEAPANVILKTGQPLWIEDVKAAGSTMTPGPGAERIRGFAGAPIPARGGGVLGVLIVAFLDPRPCEPRTLRRLADLAQLVAEGFERQLTVEQLSLTTQELKAALESSVRSEQRLQVALELAKVHVWEIDHAHAEEGEDRLPPLGAGVTQVKAQVNMWGAMHPADQPAAKALWRRHLEEGVPYEVNHRVIRKDGPHIWLEAAVKAMRAPDGRIERVIGAYRNIDDEHRNALELVKARDAAEAANQAKSAFLATMSHEIRTPLNGVLGMAQVMANEPLDTAQRERLDVIRQSGETLLAILNDILDLSKVEAGKLGLEVVDFDIEEVARGAHAAFSAVAAAKGLAFEVSVSHAAQGVYHGDPTRVRQILHNLISNALKFTERGGVRVAVGRADGRLKLRVRDTGIGIAPDRAGRLFEKFEQADTSTTRRFGGTGLGLAICRELATMMGGGVTLKSNPGKGATFTVDLPLPRVRAAGEAGPAAPAQLDPCEDLSDTPIRVLAAEDNAVNQAVLKALLNQIGVEPTIVENGVDAVAAWEAGNWDVILMDVQMPRMDGPTATQFIRSRELALGRPRTPIIALTANSMAHQVAEYLSLGMDAFVAKPIEIARLFETLQAVLAATEVVSASAKVG